MYLDPTARDVLVIVGVALGLLAVLLALLALRRLGRLRRDLVLLQAADDENSFLAIVARKTEEVQALRGQLDNLAVLLERTRADLSEALRHVSVVRYDAFGDLGGRLSFSAALLDDGGNGLILTSLHGRTETRSYLKGVRDGGGDVPLSPEELQAVSYARKGAAA